MPDDKDKDIQNNGNDPKPNSEQQGGVADPVTVAILGSGEPLREKGIKVRPKSAQESYTINEKALKGMGINSADDPRFLDLHNRATLDYTTHMAREVNKNYALIDGNEALDPDLMLIPQAPARTLINLKTYIRGRHTDFIQNSSVAPTWKRIGEAKIGVDYDVFGASYKSHTNEQLAEARRTFVSKDGTELPIALYDMNNSITGMPEREVDGEKYTLMMGYDQNGNPQWKEVQSDMPLHKEVIRSVRGPKEERSTATQTLGSSFMNTWYDMKYGTVGALAEFIGGIVKGTGSAKADLMSLDKTGDISRLFAQLFAQAAEKNAHSIFEGIGDVMIGWGNRWQNSAGMFQSKLSEEADKASTFSSHGWAKLIGSAVPQAIAQFAVSFLTRGAVKFGGIFAGMKAAGATRLANAVGQATSYTLGASYAMFAMNDEAKKNGIGEQDRLLLMGMAGAATLFSEMALARLGGSGLADAISGRKTTESEMRKAFTDVAAQSMQKALPEMAKATTEAGKMSAAKTAVGNFIKGIFTLKPIRWGIHKALDVTGKGGSLGRQLLHAGAEEAGEELVEGQINEMTKWGYDSLLADKGATQGHGAFGVDSPFMSWDEMAANLIGGMLGGIAGGSLSAAVYGIDKVPQIYRDKLHSQLAVTMNQAEAEQLVREQYAKGWYQNPTKNADGTLNKDGGDAYKAALEGELNQLRLAYAAKERLGLNNEALIAEVMGGDDALAAKALERGIAQERAKRNVDNINMQLAAATTPEDKARLQQELIIAQQDLDTTTKAVTEITSGKLLAAYKARTLYNAQKVQERMLDKEVAKAMSYDDKVAKAVELAKASQGAKWDDNDVSQGVEVVDSIIKMNDAIKQHRKGEADAIAKIGETLSLLETMDFAGMTLDQMTDTIAALEKLSNEGMDDKQIGRYKDIQRRLSEAMAKDKNIQQTADKHKKNIVDTMNDIERRRAEAEALIREDKDADGNPLNTDPNEIEQKVLESNSRFKGETGEEGKVLGTIMEQMRAYGMTNSGAYDILSEYMDGIEEQVDMSDKAMDELYTNMAMQDEVVSRGRSMGINGLRREPRKRGKTELRTGMVIPGVVVTNEDGTQRVVDYTVQGGVQEVDEDAQDDGHSKRVVLPKEARDIMRALMTIDGVNYNAQLVDRLRSVLEAGTATPADEQMAKDLAARMLHQIDVLSTIMSLVRANANGFITDKELSALGIDKATYRSLIDKQLDKEKALNKLYTELRNEVDKKGRDGKLNGDKTKIADMEAKINALRSKMTSIEKMMTLMQGQLQLLDTYASQVARLMDDFKEYNEQQRKTDILGRLWMAEQFVKHQLAGNKDATTTINGKSVMLSSLPAMGKKADEVTYGEMLQVMEWIHSYYNTKGANGQYNALSKEMLDAVLLEQPGKDGNHFDIYTNSGMTLMKWDTFTIEHISGNKKADDTKSDVSFRYRLFTLLSTIMSNSAHVWDSFKEATVGANAIVTNVPGHEQLLAAEHNIMAHTYAARRANKEIGVHLDSMWQMVSERLGIAGKGRDGNLESHLAAIMGNAGSGKTSMVLPLVMHHLKRTGLYDSVVIVGHKQSLSKPIVDAAVKAGYTGKVTAYDTIEAFASRKTSESGKTLVVLDEMTLLEPYSMSDQLGMFKRLREKYSSENKGNSIQFLGDPMQAPAAFGVRPISWLFSMTSINMSKVYRTGITGIAALQEEARKVINDDSLQEPIMFTSARPAIHYTPQDNNKEWLGVRRFTREEEDTIAQRVKARPKAIVIVLKKEHRAKWIGKGLSEEQVRCISDKETTPQGAEVDEVFIDFIIPSDYNGKEAARSYMRYWNTSVSRGKNFVGYISDNGVQNKAVDSADKVDKITVTADKVNERRAGLKEMLDTVKPSEPLVKVTLPQVQKPVVKQPVVTTQQTVKQDETAQTQAHGDIATDDDVRDAIVEYLTNAGSIYSSVIDIAKAVGVNEARVLSLIGGIAGVKRNRKGHYRLGAEPQVKKPTVKKNIKTVTTKTVDDTQDKADMPRTTVIGGKQYALNARYVYTDTSGAKSVSLTAITGDKITVTDDNGASVSLPIADADGKLSLMVNTYQDVSDQERQQMLEQGIYTFDSVSMSSYEPDARYLRGDIVGGRISDGEYTIRLIRGGVFHASDGKSYSDVVVVALMQGNVIYAIKELRVGTNDVKRTDGIAWGYQEALVTAFTKQQGGEEVWDEDREVKVYIRGKDAIVQLQPKSGRAGTAGEQNVPLSSHLESIMPLGYEMVRIEQRDTDDNVRPVDTFVVLQNGERTAEYKVEPVQLSGNDIARNNVEQSLLDDLQRLINSSPSNVLTYDEKDAVTGSVLDYWYSFLMYNRSVLMQSDKPSIVQLYDVNGVPLHQSRLQEISDSNDEVAQQQLYKELRDVLPLLLSQSDVRYVPAMRGIVKGTANVVLLDAQPEMFIVRDVVDMSASMLAIPTNSAGTGITTTVDNTIIDDLFEYNEDDRRQQVSFDISEQQAQQEIEDILGEALARRFSIYRALPSGRNRYGYVSDKGYGGLYSQAGMVSGAVTYHETAHFVIEFMMPDAERTVLYNQMRERVNGSDIDIAEALADDAMRYAMERRNLRGVSKVLRWVYDKIRQVALKWGLVRRAIEDTWYDIYVSKKYKDRPLARERSLVETEEGFMWKDTDDARNKWISLVNKIGDKEASLRILGKVRGKLGREMLAPSLLSKGSDEIGQVIHKLTEESALTAAKILLRNGYVHQYNDGSGKDKVSAQAVKAIKTDIATLPDGVYLAWNGREVYAVSKTVSSAGMMDIVHTYNPSLSKIEGNIDKRYTAVEQRGDVWHIGNRGVLQHGFAESVLINGKSISWYLAHKDTHMIPKDSRAEDAIYYYIMTGGDTQLAMLSEALPGLPIADVLSRRRKLSIGDYLNVMQAIKDSVSKKESHETHYTDSQSLFMKLVLQSIPMDGGGMASEKHANYVLLEASKRMGGKPLTVESFRDVLDERIQAYSTKESIGDTASETIRHLTAIRRYFYGGDGVAGHYQFMEYARRLASDRDNVLREMRSLYAGNATIAGMTDDDLAALIDKRGKHSANQMTAFVVFYSNHYDQQLQMVEYGGGVSSLKVRNTDGRSSGELYQRLQDGCQERWNQGTQLVSDAMFQSNIYNKDTESGNATFVRTTYENGVWSMRYSKGEAEVEIGNVTDSGDIAINEVLLHPDNNKELIGAVLYSLNKVGVTVTLRTAVQLVGKSRNSKQLRPLLEEVVNAILTGRYAAINDGDKRVNDDLLSEKKALSSVLDRNMGLYGVGGTEQMMDDEEMPDVDDDNTADGETQERHPSHMVALLSSIADVQVFTEGGFGRERSYSADGTARFVSQTSHVVNDVLGKGKQATIELMYPKALRGARQGRVMSRHVRQIGSNIVFINPLIDSRTGAAIKEMHYNGGIKTSRFNGKLQSRFSEADEWMYHEGHIRQQLDALYAGKVSVSNGISIPLFNQANRDTQPIATVDMRIIDTSNEASGVGDGVLYLDKDRSKDYPVSLDSDNLLLWTTYHYARMVKAQTDSIYRWERMFNMMVDEGAKHGDRVASGLIPNLQENSQIMGMMEDMTAAAEKLRIAEASGSMLAWYKASNKAQLSLQKVVHALFLYPDRALSVIRRYGVLQSSKDYMVGRFRRQGEKDATPFFSLGLDTTGNTAMTGTGVRLVSSATLTLGDLSMTRRISKLGEVEELTYREPRPQWWKEMDTTMLLPRLTVQNDGTVVEEKEMGTLWGMLYLSIKGSREATVKPTEQELQEHVNRIVSSYFASNDDSMARGKVNTSDWNRAIDENIKGNSRMDNDVRKSLKLLLINAVNKYSQENDVVEKAKSKGRKQHMDRGIARTHYINDKGAKKYTIADILFGTMDGSDLSLDTYSKADLLDDLFKDSYRAMEKSMYDSGYIGMRSKSKKRDKYAKMTTIESGKKMPAALRGRVIAFNLFNDAAISLMMGSNNGFAKTDQGVIELDEYGRGWINTVINSNKRFVSNTATSSRPSMTNPQGLREQGYQLFVQDLRGDHEWMHTSIQEGVDIGMLDYDSVKKTDGMVFTTPLQDMLAYHSHGAEHGTFNLEGMKKQTTMQYSIMTDVTTNQKFAQSPITATVRITSPQAMRWFALAMNPQGVTDSKDPNNPASLYEAWNNYLEAAKARDVNMPIERAIAEADRELHRFYVSQREMHERSGNPAPFKYQFISQITFIGSTKSEMHDSRAVLTYDGNAITPLSYQGINGQYNEVLNIFDEHKRVLSSQQETIPMERFYDELDNSQMRFQFNANKKTDDSANAPMTQMLQQFLALTVSDDSPAKASIDKLKDYYSDLLHEGMKDIVFRLTNRTNVDDMSTSELLDALADDETLERIETILGEQMAKSNDTSMLTRIIKAKAGLEFTGAHVRAIQLVSAWVRERMLKQDMAAMRLAVSSSTDMRVVYWYDEKGRILRLRPDHAERMTKLYGMPPVIDVQKEAMAMGVSERDYYEMLRIQGALNGVSLNIAMQPLRIAIDWDKMRVEQPELYGSLSNLMISTMSLPFKDSSRRAIRESVYREARKAGMMTTLSSDLCVPNPKGAATMGDTFQPYDILFWQTKEGIKDIRNIEHGSGRRTAIFNIVKESVDNAFAKLIRDNNGRYASYDNDAQKTLETNAALNSVLGTASENVSDRLNKMVSTKEGQQQLEQMYQEALDMMIDNNLRSRIINEDKIDEVKDYDLFQQKLQQRRLEVTPVKRENARLKLHDRVMENIQSGIINRLLGEGFANIAGKTTTNLYEWAEYITDAIIQQERLSDMFGVRVPSGPGSGTIYSVSYYHGDGGSTFYAPSERNATTGEDNDLDEQTIYYEVEPGINMDAISRKALETQNNMLRTIRELYMITDSALQLQQPIELSAWEDKAQGGANKVLYGHNQPFDITTSTALHQSNIAGDATIGISANYNKSMMLVYVADSETGGEVQHRTMVDDDGRSVPLYWSKGLDFAPYPVRNESMTNLGTDNPKLNALGMLNILPDTTIIALTQMHWQGLLDIWYREYGSGTSVGIEAVMSELLQSEANEDVVREIKRRKSILSDNKESSALAVIYDLLSKYTDKQQKAKSENQAYALGTDGGLYGAMRSDVQFIDELISSINELLGYGTKVSKKYTAAWNKTVEALRSEQARIAQEISNGNNDYELDLPYVSSAMANALPSAIYTRIESQMDKALADMDVEVDTDAAYRLYREIAEREASQEADETQRSEVEQYLIELAQDKDEVRKAFFTLKAKMGALRRRRQSRKNNQRILNTKYYDTLSTLYRVALASEWGRRFGDIAGLNQGVPSHPYQQRLSIRNIESITGVSIDRLMELINEWEKTGRNGNGLEQFLTDRVGALQQRQEMVRQRIADETANRSMQKGKEYLYKSVTVSLIEDRQGRATANVSMPNAVSQQGDALKAVLSSSHARRFIQALVMVSKVNGHWAFFEPVVQQQYQSFLDDTGQDELSEYGFENMRHEWDKAVGSMWMEWNGIHSPSYMFHQALKDMELEGYGAYASSGTIFRVDNNGIPIDLHTVEGRNRACVELVDLNKRLIDDLRGKYNETEHPEVAYLLSELATSTTRDGNKTTTLIGTNESYDDAARETLRKGMAMLPRGVRRMIELWQILQHGWEYRRQSPLASIITTELHKEYGNYLQMVLYPMLRNGSMPGILSQFFDQLKHKTHIEGVMRFAQWDGKEYQPPIGKNGLVRHYIEPVRLPNGRKAKMHAEVTSVPNVSFSMRARTQGDSAAVPMGMDSNSPLSVTRLLLDDGHSVESYTRLEREIQRMEIDYQGDMKSKQYKFLGMDITSQKGIRAFRERFANYWNDRWDKPKRETYDWIERSEQRLMQVYRKAILGTKDDAVKSRIVELFVGDRNGNKMILTDNASLGNIAKLWVEWISAAKPLLDGKELSWDNISSALEATESVIGKQTKSRKNIRYSTSRIGITNMSYSTIDNTHIVVNLDGTKERASEVRLQSGVSMEDSTSASILANAAKEYAAGRYSNAAQLITDGFKGNVNVYDNGEISETKLYDLLVRRATQWREVKLDAQMLIDHIKHIKNREANPVLTMERKYSHPYAVGDVVHFNDGNIGIVTEVYGFKGKKRLPSGMHYVLIQSGDGIVSDTAIGKAQATAWIEAIASATGIQVEQRSTEEMGGSKGYVSLDDTGVHVVMPTSADTGQYIHEWGHLWSATVKNEMPEMWSSIISSLRGTAIWQHAKDVSGYGNMTDVELMSDGNEQENAIVEYEAVAYLLQYAHYHRTGELGRVLDDTLSTLRGAIERQLEDVIGNDTQVSYMKHYLARLKNPITGRYSYEAKNYKVNVSRLADNNTFADLAEALMRAMAKTKIESYNSKAWSLLPNVLHTMAGTSSPAVRGVNVSNIDKHFLPVMPSTTPAKDVLMRGVMQAKQRGDDKYFTPGGSVVVIVDKGIVKSDSDLATEVSKLTKDLTLIDKPAQGVYEFLNRARVTADIHKAAADTMRGWSERATDETKSKRRQELQEWLDHIGYNPKYDKVLDKAGVMALGVADAAVSDDAIVIVKDAGTANEHYSILMMSGEHLGTSGVHKGKRLNYLTGDGDGVYLKTGVGDRMALKGAILAMALKKAGKQRIDSVVVSTAGTLRSQVHLVSDLLTQVERIIVNDKTLMASLQGGLYDLMADKTLLDIDGYYGNALDNLVNYAKTMHSRIPTSEKGSDTDKYLDAFVTAGQSVQGGDKTMMGELLTKAHRRYHFLRSIVLAKDKEAIANNREIQQLGEMIRRLSTGRNNAMVLRRMTLEEKYVQTPSHWSNPVMVWLRDSIEQAQRSVRMSLTTEVEWMGAKTKELNDSVKVLSLTWDNADKLFGAMFKMAKAKTINGDDVMVQTGALHVDDKDPDTAEALRNGSLTRQQLALAKEVHGRIMDELVEYLYATDRSISGGTKEEVKGRARAKAEKMMANGRIPVMQRRSSAALAKGDYRDAMRLWSDNLLNVEAPSESYYDPNATIEDEHLRSFLFDQMDGEHLYGGDERMMLLGLAVDDTGGLVLIDDNKNRNTSNNLFDIHTVSMVHSLRTRKLRRAVSDARIGLDMVHSLRSRGIDTNDMEDVLRTYVNRTIFGTLPKSKTIQIGANMVEVDKVLGGVGQIGYMSFLAFSPLVAAKSAVSNATKLMMNAMINSVSGNNMFGTAALTRAIQEVTSNAAKAEAVNRLLGVVGRSERDLLNHLKHNPTQKNLSNKDTAFIGMWYGDYYSQLIGMVAQMIQEGTYDAYTMQGDKLVYDQTKDGRFYKDGKQTDNGKLLMEDVLAARKRSGEQQDSDTVLTAGYDSKEMMRLRAITQRFAGESADPTMKSHMQAFGLARAALTMRSWVINAVNVWYKRSSEEDLLGGRTVVNGEVKWVGRPTEGVIQTVGALLGMLKKGGADKWKAQTAEQWQWRKRNLAILGAHGAALYLLMMVIEMLMDDDDEEEWSMKEETFRYTIMGGMREQMSMGLPWLIYNDVSNNPSAITGVFENTLSAAWETVKLPYNIFLAPDTMTEGGKLSKLDKDTQDYIADWAHTMSKAVNIGGRLYRDGEMVVGDVVIGEGGNKE